MNILSIDKWDGDRDNKIIVHLNLTDVDIEAAAPFLWLLPNVNDSSDEWVMVQAWLDDGGNITDSLKGAADVAYVNKRANAYPPLEDQLDKIFHEGIDAWKADIQAVKDAIPKP